MVSLLFPLQIYKQTLKKKLFNRKCKTQVSYTSPYIAELQPSFWLSCMSRVRLHR